MKPFYDNLFYDMDQGTIDRSAFAMLASRAIRDRVVEVQYKIKELEPKKALALLQEMLNEY